MLPTLPRIENEIKYLLKSWKVHPKIVLEEEKKWEVFEKASVALAASGTVSLELSLCKIPMILAYKVDFFSKIFILPKIKIWSAALPNLILNEPIIPEYFNEFACSGILYRQIIRHIFAPNIRSIQLEGFNKIISIMQMHKSSGSLAADIVLSYIN